MHHLHLNTIPTTDPLRDCLAAFVEACGGEPETRLGWLDKLLADVDALSSPGVGELLEDPTAFWEALHESRNLAQRLRAALEQAKTIDRRN